MNRVRVKAARTKLGAQSRCNLHRNKGSVRGEDNNQWDTFGESFQGQPGSKYADDVSVLAILWDLELIIAELDHSLFHFSTRR